MRVLEAVSPLAGSVTPHLSESLCETRGILPTHWLFEKEVVWRKPLCRAGAKGKHLSLTPFVPIYLASSPYANPIDSSFKTRLEAVSCSPPPRVGHRTRFLTSSPASTLALPLIEVPYTTQVRLLCWFIFIALGIKSNFKTCSRALQVSTWFVYIHLPRLISWNPISSCPLNSSLTGLLWVPTQWACFCFRTFGAAIPSAWNVLHINSSTPWAFPDPPNFSSHFEWSLSFIADSFDTVLFSVYLLICKFSLPPLLQWI